MKHVMIWLVRLYKKVLSPILPNSCRFTPTCSSYAIEAFEKRGFFAGFILTVWRILRCNPFCKGGYDPVPEKGFRRVRTEQNPKHTETETVAEQKNIEAEFASSDEPGGAKDNSAENFRSEQSTADAEPVAQENSKAEDGSDGNSSEAKAKSSAAQ